MTNTMWRVAAGAFTVAVLVAGFLVAWNVLRPPADIKTDTEQQTYAQAIGRIVFSDFGASDIAVEAGEAAQVEVTRDFRWRGDKPRLRESWSGDTLTVSHNCGNSGSDDCSIRYRVRVPADVAVEASASSGDVSVRNINGSVRLATTSGDVTLSGVSGALAIRTTSGDVSTSDLRTTQVDMAASSGNVKLSFSVAPQTLAVQTTSGDTTITVPRASGPYLIKLQTASGDQRVSVDESRQAERSIDVQATSGDVTIGYA